MVVEQGLPRRLVGGLERAELDMSPAACHALAQALSVPDWWFTTPFDQLWPTAQPDEVHLDILTRLERIERKLDG